MSEIQNLDPVPMERLQKLGGNAFVGKMIALFLDYAGRKVLAARQAQASGNLIGLQEAVHPIKSSAGNVGARRLQELAQRIEQLAMQGQAGELATLTGELEAAFAAVKVELERKQQALGTGPI